MNRPPIDARSHREKLAVRLRARLAQQPPEPTTPPAFNAQQRRELELGIARMERDQERYELDNHKRFMEKERARSAMLAQLVEEAIAAIKERNDSYNPGTGCGLKLPHCYERVNTKSAEPLAARLAADSATGYLDLFDRERVRQSALLLVRESRVKDYQGLWKDIKQFVIPLAQEMYLAYTEKHVNDEN